MLAHSKKAFFFPSVWPGTEHIRAPIWKKRLRTCFESYHGMVLPIPSHRQSRQRMMNTSLIYVRDSLEKPELET